MATSLAEIRAKLQASENRGTGGNSQGGGDNAIRTLEHPRRHKRSH